MIKRKLFELFAAVTVAVGLLIGCPRATLAQDSGQYDAYIREASVLYSIPEALIRAIIRVESNFHPNVVSRSGAIGLMQLMPVSARSVGVTDLFDPRQNILGGTRALRLLANHYGGDLELTIMAYNAGRSCVDRYLRREGSIPSHTRERYLPTVLRYFDEYR